MNIIILLLVGFWESFKCTEFEIDIFIVCLDLCKDPEILSLKI